MSSINARLQVDGTGTVRVALRADAPGASPFRMTCMVCFESRVAVTGDGVTCGMRCEADEFCCAVCLPEIVKGSAERAPTQLSPAEREADRYHVACPCGCSNPYDEDALLASLGRRFPHAPNLEERARNAADRLRTAQRLLDEVKQLQQNMGSMSKDELMLLSVRAQFRKADGQYSAYMCKRCGFGPVAHGACNDLRAHHHEARWRGFHRTRISNSCPQCGWFNKDIAQWPKWDGAKVGATRPKLHHKVTLLASHLEPSPKTKTAMGYVAAAPLIAVILPFVAAAIASKAAVKAWKKRRRRAARARAPAAARAAAAAAAARVPPRFVRAERANRAAEREFHRQLERAIAASRETAAAEEAARADAAAAGGEAALASPADPQQTGEEDGPFPGPDGAPGAAAALTRAASWHGHSGGEGEQPLGPDGAAPALARAGSWHCPSSWHSRRDAADECNGDDDGEGSGADDEGDAGEDGGEGSGADDEALWRSTVHDAAGPGVVMDYNDDDLELDEDISDFRFRLRELMREVQL